MVAHHERDEGRFAVILARAPLPAAFTGAFRESATCELAERVLSGVWRMLDGGAGLSAREAGGGDVFWVDADALRQRMRDRVRFIVEAEWGDCPEGFPEELEIPPLSLHSSDGYAAEQARTALLASLASFSANLAVFAGVLKSETTADLAIDLLIEGGLGRDGITPGAARRRMARDRERRLRGMALNLQLRIYEIVAPQLVEAVCRLGTAADLPVMAIRS